MFNLTIYFTEKMGTRKSPRLNRVPTQGILIDSSSSNDSLIGLTASRMYAKSSGDPGAYSSLFSIPETTPEKGKREASDGEVPVVNGEREGKKEGAEVEYLIRRRGVGASTQVSYKHLTKIFIICHSNCY